MTSPRVYIDLDDTTILRVVDTTPHRVNHVYLQVGENLEIIATLDDLMRLADTIRDGVAHVRRRQARTETVVGGRIR